MHFLLGDSFFIYEDLHNLVVHFYKRKKIIKKKNNIKKQVYFYFLLCEYKIKTNK